MSVSAAMQRIGEDPQGRVWFYADNSFTKPGIYYWSGTENVHLQDYLASLESDLSTAQERIKTLEEERKEISDLLCLGSLPYQPCLGVAVAAQFDIFKDKCAALKSERDKLQQERDTWKRRYEEKEKPTRALGENIASLQKELEEVKRERDVNQSLLEALERADKATSPFCSHNQQYLWSPDGVGKKIICLLCNYEKLTVENARLREVLKILFTWYSVDGSVGGASLAFEQANALLAPQSPEPAAAQVEEVNPTDSNK